MKLTFSEAILIGDSLKSPDPRFFLSPDGSRGCAIGGAALAVGIRKFIAHPTNSPEFMAAFPWVTFAHCADISLQYDLVCKGWETIEQLADFVRSIEPTDSSAPILSAGSGEDGLLCDSSPLSQVSCGTVEGHGAAPLSLGVKAASLRETRLLSQSDSESFGTREQTGVGTQAPPAGIHLAGERIDAQTSAEQLGENPLSPSMGTRLHSPAIHILPSRKPLVLSQSTVGILDAYQEDIEAEREGSDLGGYPDPADNPRFA